MYDNMRIGEYLARGFKVKVANLKDTDLFSFAELRNNFGLLDIAPWYNVLGGIGDDLIAYYQRLKANGYNLDSKPNCSISTIHAAKGGEADHVVLLSDMAYRSHQEYVKQPDNERRVAYVGVTRAKEKLSIVLPQSKLFFDFYGESQ
jgi:superfamily I DNA/RNA helicase